MQKLDDLLIKKKALPAANAANFGDSIDLFATQGSTAKGSLTEANPVLVRVAVPATPSLANDISLTLTVKDSADDSTFAPIEGLGAVLVTGAGGAGGGAKAVKLWLPPHTRRYVRLDAAVAATGGNNTAVSYEFAVLK